MRRIPVVFVFAFLCTLDAAAQVRVSVKIDAPLMIAKYKPRTADVELAIARELAKELPSYFKQWSYAATPAVPGTVSDFTLAFRIQKVGGAHLFALDLQAPAMRINGWNTVWMGPGDHIARGFPDRSSAGAAIGAEILQVLIGPKQAEIFADLKKVPLALTGQWLPVVGRQNEPRLVIPLAWPGSSSLVRSKLRIDCAGSARLVSEAADAWAYYDDKKSPRYPALVVKPLVRIIGTDETPVKSIKRRQMIMMQPVAIYLESLDASGLRAIGGSR